MQSSALAVSSHTHTHTCTHAMLSPDGGGRVASIIFVVWNCLSVCESEYETPFCSQIHLFYHTALHVNWNLSESSGHDGEKEAAGLASCKFMWLSCFPSCEVTGRPSVLANCLLIVSVCAVCVCALALRALRRKWTNYSPRWSGHEGQLLNWLMLLACSLLSGEKWSAGRSVLTTHAATVYVCPCVLIFVLRFTFFVSPPARLQMWKKSQFISNTRKHAERLQQCWLVTACDKNIKVCAYHADDLVWCFMLAL